MEASDFPKVMQGISSKAEVTTQILVSPGYRHQTHTYRQHKTEST